MKRLLLLIAVFTSCSVLVKAQTSGTATRPEKCGTMSHLDAMKLQNPGLEQQMASDEARLQNIMDQQAASRTSSPSVVYTIPVVVHVVYRTTGQNISNAQIQSQIDVLNEDYAKLNADTVNIGSGFQALASSTQFQFCLANTDPNGNLTTGIERVQTTTTAFTQNDNVKHTSTGGLDAWDVNNYFNIWVCNMSGGILGYAEFPAATHTNTYGVVIQYNSFGRVGTVSAPYNLGRTAAHEIGHCFRLYHIWGDDGGSCSGTDYVADTPNQADMTYGCLNYPANDACNSTASGIMFNNYMDYSDDDCLNMFTVNQAARMYTAVNTMYNTLLHSTRCESPNGVNEVNNLAFSVYPNPTDGIVNIDMFTLQQKFPKLNLRVTDVVGRVVSETSVENPSGRVEQLDLSNEANGIYFVTLYNNEVSKTVKFTIAR
ncbi:MAG: T9SS type A sorting domain-containing protein [Bacteroidetes bacterium]|nr:T9SS type A sorting domain-containing protein [Bacteroidota bacterium]